MHAIDAGLLKALTQGGNAPLAGVLAPLLQAQLVPSGIDTPLRVAHFLGQSVYETGYLSRLEENLHYSAERIPVVFHAFADRADELAGNPERLANAVYANRYENGDEASGDGWRFRGRGLFQLTFRANYAEFGYDDMPEIVGTADGAVESGIKFWKARHLNSAADADSIEKVTRIVTGGASGLNERALIKHQAMRFLTA